MAAKKKTPRGGGSGRKVTKKKSGAARTSGGGRTRKATPSRKTSKKRAPAGKSPAAPAATPRVRARKRGGGSESTGAEWPRDPLDPRSLEQLANLMDRASLAEIEIQDGPDRRVRLSRRVAAADSQPVVAAPPPVPAPATGPPPDPAASRAEDGGEKASDVIEFVSPMVGTFYRAASPEAEPYVTPGDIVQPDSVLCIIEAMKVMNEIKAEVAGEIVDILVENGEAVEFGQPLFHIRVIS